MKEILFYIKDRVALLLFVLSTVLSFVYPIFILETLAYIYLWLLFIGEVFVISMFIGFIRYQKYRYKFDPVYDKNLIHFFDNAIKETKARIEKLKEYYSTRPLNKILTRILTIIPLIIMVIYGGTLGIILSILFAINYILFYFVLKKFQEN